jgi:predicted nucleic acid-binding protein
VTGRLPVELAQQHVVTYAQPNVVQVTTELILTAIDLHRLHNLSFWDALILRSARAGGCTVVLSEDMTHGQNYDGVRVENPFIR